MTGFNNVYYFFIAVDNHNIHHAILIKCTASKKYSFLTQKAGNYPMYS